MIPYFIWAFLFLVLYLVLGKVFTGLRANVPDYSFFDQILNIFYSIRNFLFQNNMLCITKTSPLSILFSIN